MNVFISWSGDLSKEIAKAINEWLPMVIQAVKTFYSPDDIQKGEFWTTRLRDELTSNDTGIICVTQDNQVSAWLTFEAGALSKGITKQKVFPLLFNMDIAELKKPLSLFNATKFNKEDFKKLIMSINNDLDNNRLDNKILDQLYDTLWPEINSRIKKAIEKYSKNNQPQKLPVRSNEDMIKEGLELQRETHRMFKEFALLKVPENTKASEEIYFQLKSIIENLDNKVENIESFELKAPNLEKSRPKKIMATVDRFTINEEKWVTCIGFIHDKPYEIFSGLAENFYLPPQVNKGWIILNKTENDEERYDFQFEDKQGYKITIEGLSNTSRSPYKTINYLISILLSNSISFDLIENIISKLEFENVDDFEQWKTVTIEILSKYYKK